MEVNYFAIFLSLLLIILKRCSAKICQLIQVLLNRSESDNLKQLYAELRELTKEREEISMVDQFAQYAIVDRKINKVNDKIQQLKAESRTKNRDAHRGRNHPGSQRKTRSLRFTPSGPYGRSDDGFGIMRSSAPFSGTMYD